MSYRNITEDGNGRIIEDVITHTLDEYKIFLLNILKEKWKENFPSFEKQLNLANNLLSEDEAALIKDKMSSLLKEYEENKIKISNSMTHEEAHVIVYK